MTGWQRKGAHINRIDNIDNIDHIHKDIRMNTEIDKEDKGAHINRTDNIDHIRKDIRMNMEVQTDDGAHINRVHPDPKHVVDSCFDLQPDLLYNILYDDMKYTVHFRMNI